MIICSRSIALQKAGNTLEEYEDACWPENELEEEVDKSNFAIADGATETSYSRLWAQKLVNAYRQGEITKRTLKSALPVLQRQWRESIGATPLPWYAEEKLSKGAFSSLLGLTIRKTKTAKNGRWNALAIGDSCLFQIRNNKELITSFPIKESSQFTNRPALLSTNPGLNDSVNSLLLTADGDVYYEDQFFLMTDAVACWFLSEYEQGRTPWRDVREWCYNKDVKVEEIIQRLRKEKKLNNDDVTIILIDIDEELE